jgi:hypothetical protein
MKNLGVDPFSHGMAGRLYGVCLLVLLLCSAPAPAQEPGDSSPGLKPVPSSEWSELHVRRVLQAFANGGQPDVSQIRRWAAQAPERAIAEMLTFDPVNLALSPQGIDYVPAQFCDSLEATMAFLSSDDPANPMRAENRPWYATLDPDDPIANPLHLYVAWTRIMHTPGCNAFLHKTALYLTNYHAAISVDNSGPTLMRSYYDDTVAALADGADFVELMTQAAAHAALARAYGHMDNQFDRDGEFRGNDDFAREYFQLLFGIQGTTEDPIYHETVTIENNAWLLSGMALDAEPDAWGSEFVLDWLVAPIDFSDHFDAAGRPRPNTQRHFRSDLGADSCLEILRESICGANALEKLVDLGPVAANHPESLASTPLKFIRYFGDDRIDPGEAADLQAAWLEMDLDLLSFLRAYAVSTRFHATGTVKLRNAFDRNLLIHNANQLTTEQLDAELFFEGPIVRMFNQGALVFVPVRDVFGGQTGNDVANDRFVFKRAWDANVDDPGFLGRPSAYYQPAPEAEYRLWRRDWGGAIPANRRGEHRVSEVAHWLWNHFIGDGGARFDAAARAQVHAMLATGYDFGVLMERHDPGRAWTAADLQRSDLAMASARLGDFTLDLASEEGNERVGLVVNFITALPWTYALEVE